MQAGLETATSVDLAADSFSTATTASASAGTSGNVGDEAYGASTEVVNTLAQLEVDGSNAAAVLPDSLTVTADKTDTTSLYEWKSLRSRLSYILGLNYGLPNGLDVVSDGRRK